LPLLLSICFPGELYGQDIILGGIAAFALVLSFSLENG